MLFVVNTRKNDAAERRSNIHARARGKKEIGVGAVIVARRSVQYYDFAMELLYLKKRERLEREEQVVESPSLLLRPEHSALGTKPIL